MTNENTCPMTGEPHLWGDWERAVVVPGFPAGPRVTIQPDRIPTGDRARQCRVCGRWEIEWAD